MNIFDRPDFDELLAGIIYDSRVQSPDCDVVIDESEEWEMTKDSQHTTKKCKMCMVVMITPNNGR